MKKKLKLAACCSAVSLIIITGFVLLLADSWDYTINKENFYAWEKGNFGGILINNSGKSVEITDNMAIIKIPSGKTSRQKGVFDADDIIINRPTKFEGTVYKNGAIKFCDFSIMQVTSDGNTDEIKPSFLYKFCSLFEEVGWSSRLGNGYVRL